MKHLHIVCRYRSPSMERMSAPLLADDTLKRFYDVTVSDQPDPEADINYHLPWHSMVGLERGKSQHVIVYTHVNPTDEGALLDACERADKIVCMTFTGRQELITRGIDPAKLWVIYSGSDGFKFRRRNIGVVGYEQPNGRKRTHMLIDLAWQMSVRDKAVIQFVLVGTGMQELAQTLSNSGIPAIYQEDLSHDDLNSTYSAMDALLVTGYVEGGPLPFMEAYACGVPVFAPCIGFAGDFSFDDYIYSGLDDLVEKFHQWLSPAVENALLANALDWTQYAVENALVLGRLSDTSAELQDGCDRYTQLLDIIDEIKPRRIVEIGTWNGARAVQMIQAAAAHRPIEDISYLGFDLFEGQTAQDLKDEGSKGGWPMSVVEKRIKATRARFQLIPGYTKDTLPTALIYRDGAKLFFIDGGHKEETIRSDWDVIKICVDDESDKDSSVIVFDDYYHGEHPAGMGCNRITDNLDQGIWEVTHLPVITKTNGLNIGMVKVKKHANLHLHGRDARERIYTSGEYLSVDYLRDLQPQYAPQAASGQG